MEEREIIRGECERAGKVEENERGKVWREREREGRDRSYGYASHIKLGGHIGIGSAPFHSSHNSLWLLGSLSFGQIMTCL